MSEFKDQAPEPKRAPPAERPAQKNPSLWIALNLFQTPPTGVYITSFRIYQRLIIVMEGSCQRAAPRVECIKPSPGELGTWNWELGTGS